MKDIILTITFICMVATGIAIGPISLLLIMFNYTTAGFLVLVMGNITVAVFAGIIIGFLSTMKL